MTGDDSSVSATRSNGHLTVTAGGSVAVITIDRPEKHNALDAAAWPALRAILADLAADGRTRAVVLTGAGDRAFSAGGDIEGFAELADIPTRRAFQADALATFAAIEECPLPVIAAVNGLALGGGCELALACDVVMASSSARFGMPEAGVGLVPGFGVLRAPEVIGRQWTKLMVFAGEQVDADTAARIGLAQKVVAPGDLLREAGQLALRMAAAAPLAVSVGKKLVNRGVDRGDFAWSLEAISLLMGSDDVAEGIRAFAQRRQPQFEGH